MTDKPSTPERSQASTPAPADSPLMKAWEAYKATPEYANSRKWALLAKAGEQNERDVDGSLWAAFVEGRNSVAQSENERTHPDVRELYDELQRRDENLVTRVLNLRARLDKLEGK